MYEVLNGHADYAVTGADLLLNFTQGQPVKVLGAIFLHSPYVVISPIEKILFLQKILWAKRLCAPKTRG